MVMGELTYYWALCPRDVLEGGGVEGGGGGLKGGLAGAPLLLRSPYSPRRRRAENS